MPRIRTIKPEFWDSPGIEELDPAWRLLYIGMWNWADDSGRGKAEARELMGFVFPRDEEMTLGEFRRGLGEIRRVFGVTFYVVDGRSFYAIPSWDRHQKIDKRSGSRWPAPEAGHEYDPSGKPQVRATSPQPHRDSAETPPNSRRDSGAGTGEQGNRGTEEQGIKHSSIADADGDDREELALIVPEDPGPSEQDLFDAFWAEYPRKDGKKPARQKFTQALKRASARDIIDGAHRYAVDPNRDQAYTKQPATWLNNECWEDPPLPPRGGGRQTATQRRSQEVIDLVARNMGRDDTPQRQVGW